MYDWASDESAEAEAKGGDTNGGAAAAADGGATEVVDGGAAEAAGVDGAESWEVGHFSQHRGRDGCSGDGAEAV